MNFAIMQAELNFFNGPVAKDATEVRRQLFWN